PGALDPASAPLRVVHAEALAFLKTLPDASEDVILFDPMFSRPKKAQPAFEVLRRHATHVSLSPELLEEARRVARRRVLVKAGRYGGELRRLGLASVGKSRSSELEWGVLDVAAASADR